MQASLKSEFSLTPVGTKIPSQVSRTPLFRGFLKPRMKGCWKQETQHLALRRIRATAGPTLKLALWPRCASKSFTRRDVIASRRSGGHILGICEGGNGATSKAIGQTDQGNQTA